MKKSNHTSDRSYILIVEDENLFYRDIANYLKEKGFEVAPYTKNYKDAKKHFHDRLPDAVLMDIDLNDDLNGFNVAQYIREYSDIPIIFLSNLPTFENIEEAWKRKADDFLIKSALRNNEQIFTTLHMMLNKKNKQYPKYGIRVLTKFKPETQNNSQSPIDLFKTIAENDEKKEYLVKNNEMSIILPFQDIAYITTFKYTTGEKDIITEKGKGFVAFYCKNGNIYYKFDTLKNLKEEKLPEYFLFCNQSYIVNAYAVNEILSASKINIINKEIPVSDRYRQQFFRDLRKFYVD